MKVRLKIQKRNRLHEICVGLSCLVIFMLAGNAFFWQVADKIESIFAPQTTQVFTYQVSAGDTLWMLASRSIAQDEDVRDKIIAIRKLNGLSASQGLVPGQMVMVPVKNLNDTRLRYTFKTQ